MHDALSESLCMHHSLISLCIHDALMSLCKNDALIVQWRSCGRTRCSQLRQMRICIIHARREVWTLGTRKSIGILSNKSFFRWILVWPWLFGPLRLRRTYMGRWFLERQVWTLGTRSLIGNYCRRSFLRWWLLEWQLLLGTRSLFGNLL